jgi:hypothetical protein
MKTHETMKKPAGVARGQSPQSDGQGARHLPGLTAIRTLIGEGSTSCHALFSQQVYADVAEAYISGLEVFAKGRDLTRYAASFVSRIDTLVDDELTRRSRRPPTWPEGPSPEGQG